MTTWMMETLRNLFRAVRTPPDHLQSGFDHHTVETLVIKWGRANKGVSETENAYQELTARLESDWVETWNEQADRASVEGGASRKIYNVDVQHGAVILTSGFKPTTDGVLQNLRWRTSVCSWQNRNRKLGTCLEVLHGCRRGSTLKNPSR
jgi:hypothetical protein